MKATKHKCFSFLQTNPSAKCRLVLFPYAGAQPTIYTPWKNLFPKHVEIVLAQYPGKGMRAGEFPIARMSKLIEDLGRDIGEISDKPVILFGHSNGALVAYELGKYMEREGVSNLLHVIVSAKSAPSNLHIDEYQSELPFDKLVEVLGKYGNTPMELLDDKEMLRSLAPSIRADFGLSEYYEISDKKLFAPVSYFYAADDHYAQSSDIAEWQKFTGLRFSSVKHHGGHFFLHSSQDATIASIRKVIDTSLENAKRERVSLNYLKDDNINDLLTEAGAAVVAKAAEVLPQNDCTINPSMIAEDSRLVTLTDLVVKVPFFLKPSLSKNIATGIERMQNLLYKLPSLLFDNDKERIANHYFNGNLEMSELLLDSDPDANKTVIRFDFAVNKGRIAFIEANAGSSLGGIDVISSDKIIREQDFVKDAITKHPEHQYTHPEKNFTRFVISQIRKIKSGGDIVIAYIVDEEVVFGDALRRMLLEQTMPVLSEMGESGNVLIVKMEDLRFDGKNLYHEDTIVDAVINQAEARMSDDMLAAYKAKAFYTPESPWSIVAGDKTSLALLYENADKGIFSPEDVEHIYRYIPWSSIIAEKKEVTYKNGRYDLINLLVDNKDNFVIKDAYGSSGSNVFVGIYCTQEAWESAILYALASSNPFIAQEYCASSSAKILSRKGYIPHQIVWGGFDFGGNYGGSWLRAMPIGSGNGVVNSATGAVEIISYEDKNCLGRGDN